VEKSGDSRHAARGGEGGNDDGDAVQGRAGI